MRHFTLFLLLTLAVPLSAQFTPQKAHTEAIQSFKNLSQTLSTLTSEYDYKRYDFRWGIVSMAWDSTTTIDAFALEENGQLNFYLYESRYDVFDQQSMPNSLVILYGVNTELGTSPELFDGAGFGYFADSLLIYQYDEDLEDYIPVLFGYLTAHSGNLLQSMEVYLNIGGTTEPPYDLVPFGLTNITYDMHDRPVTIVTTELDLFELEYYNDSTLFVYNGADQVIQATSFTNDTLWYIEHITYPGGEGTLSSIAVTSYYDLNVVTHKDSLVTLYQNTTDYLLRAFDSWGGSPYEWTYQETFMMVDTLSLLTSFSIDGGAPAPFHQVQRRYDNLGRISSILELSDWPKGTLSNDNLAIFEYAQSSSVHGVSSALTGFSHYLSGHELIMEFDTPFEGDVTLFTSTGQAVAKARIAGMQASVHLPAIPSGIYFGFLNGRDMRGGFGFRYVAE